MAHSDHVALSFLTFNIFADVPGFAHLDRRLELQAEAIAALRPDAAALQELVRSPMCGDIGARLCEAINRRLPSPEYRLHDAMADGTGDGQWRFEEGLGLLTRHPAVTEPEILKFDSQVRLGTRIGAMEYRLPDDRIALHIRLAIAPALTVDIYATHLTDRTEAIGGVLVNTAQARELARWIATTGAPENPVLLGGDFNAPPESDTIRALTDTGLVDIHAAAGRGTGYTNDRDDLDLERPDNTANQRIDFCFFRPSARHSCRIESAGLFLDRPHATPEGGWLWASDHFGVVTRIVFDL